MVAALVALLAADAWLSRSDATGLLSALGGGALTTAAFALLALAGGIELCRLCQQAGYRPPTAWSLMMIVVIVVEPWLTSPHGRQILANLGSGAVRLSHLDGIVPALAILGIAAVLVWRQRTAGAIPDFATGLLAIFYVGFLGSFAVRMRCWQPGPEGAWLVLATLAIVKITDIGAYFTGVMVGKRKLIPKISPGKTWEGLFGGIAASGIVAGVLLGWALPRGLDQSVLRHLSMAQAVVFGVLMAIVGQMGDLAESLFKRDSKAKDSAKLVPEFGGVLDLIDSPLAAVPVGYLLLRWWLGA